MTPPENFYFTVPDDNNKQEIIQVVYEAHLSAGYDAIGTRGKDEVKEAINRRFDLFNQTNTLNISTLVKSSKNNEIAGVCIAGVYPPAASDSFSTIHQVSVRPQFRRKGIAEAMMLNSINKAHSVSPVITLGVTVGNPAEILYNKIGFLGGPKSSEIHFTV